mmetsp:Transcript_73458/g.192643  ORF Transcript_73458/g.192643 Transcript_73458/m.192643 type:complete len:203 (-) Transcript_73458:11-619(-)
MPFMQVHIRASPPMVPRFADSRQIPCRFLMAPSLSSCSIPKNVASVSCTMPDTCDLDLSSFIASVLSAESMVDSRVERFIKVSTCSASLPRIIAQPALTSDALTSVLLRSCSDLARRKVESAIDSSRLASSSEPWFSSRRASSTVSAAGAGDGAANTSGYWRALVSAIAPPRWTAAFATANHSKAANMPPARLEHSSATFGS